MIGSLLAILRCFDRVHQERYRLSLSIQAGTPYQPPANRQTLTGSASGYALRTGFKG